MGCNFRKLTQNLVTLFLGVTLALLLGEGLIRLHFWIFSGGAHASGNGRQEGRITAFDPLLGWRHIPNSQERFRTPEYDLTVTINAQGLREDRNIPYEKPPGTLRILLVGDSLTFGYGVKTTDRFGEKIEAVLDNVETVNMGVAGTGTDQQLLLYRQEGYKYSADLVILGYLTEHIRRNMSTIRRNLQGIPRAKPKFILRDGDLLLTNVPLPDSPHASALKNFLQQSALYSFLRVNLFSGLQRLLRGNSDPQSAYNESSEAWQVTQALFKQFTKETYRNGSKFLLVIIPIAKVVNENYVDALPHRMIRELGEKEGIAVLDLLPGFNKAAQNGKSKSLYYPIDRHWTPEGHTVAAELIAQYLKGIRSDVHIKSMVPPSQ